MDEIIRNINYCLKCKTKPCKDSCPIGTEIPKMIEYMQNDNMLEAYKVLKSNNLFTSICSEICPDEQQCQKNCTRSIKGEAVNIRLLEKTVNDWAKDNNILITEDISSTNGKTIAIIGGGPAGLSAAYELLKRGYNIDLYEKEKQLGGLLYYGIPDFRISKEKIENVLENFSGLNVKFYMNKELGKDINLLELKEKYNAVYLAIGSSIPAKYEYDEKMKGIYTSDVFLRKYSMNETFPIMQNVVVIGGGNVATDCARVAKRKGAEKVTIIYRNKKEKLSATKFEVEEAENDGVEFIYNTRVIEGKSDNNKLTSINCVDTIFENEKLSDIPDSNFFMKADTLIYAIGQKPDLNLLNKKYQIECDENGFVKVNDNFQTSLENVFAGGDIIAPKGTICKAAAYGKKAAEKIDKYLKEEK